MATSTEVLNSSPCCFLLIFGIPGSGKTSLSRQLVKTEPQTQAPGLTADWKWLHICMDEYYPPDTRTDKQEKALTSEFNWKGVRHQVMSYIEDYINNRSSPISERRAPNNTTTVLVIDDNLPLTSMRYEYYQLARKYRCGFVSVCLHCELEVALHRNSQRTTPVPSQTIVDMFQTIEEPKDNWETVNYIRFDTSYENWSMDTCVKIITKCSNALHNPILPISEPDIAKIQAAQRQTSESVLHTADQILRQLVSSEISSFQGEGKEEKKEVASRANKARKIILEEMRNELDNYRLPLDELKEHLKLKYYHVLSTI